MFAFLLSNRWFTALWITLGVLLFNGCSFFIGDERARKIQQIREELYQENKHHRFTVGQITHTFEQSQYRDAVKKRFNDDIPITLGKNIGFEYSINHFSGWLNDVSHYAFTIEGNTGDSLTMSHTDFSTILNYYLWRALGSEMGFGAGVGIQYLQRGYTTTNRSIFDTDNRVTGILQAQYNQIFTDGFALSYTLRTVYIDSYEFENPDNDRLNKIAEKSLRYKAGGAQAIIGFYFPFFTQPRQ